ncbi:MAG: endonuclease [Saprospiraceae bacterium]|nr:endonuclease [Saprospiraceae bacterium]
MREIELTQGKVALVDDDDFEWLNQWKWHYTKRGYATRTTWDGVYRGKIKMHREIMKLGDFKKDPFEIDHKDRNRLNNCKSNLRICTRGQNEINKPKNKGTSSKYKGVIYDKERNKWRTSLDFNGKAVFMKRFSTEIEAAIAYNEQAITYFGEFANLNVID